MSSPKTRREIASSTVQILKEGTYSADENTYSLAESIEYMTQNTAFYPAYSDVLSPWKEASPSAKAAQTTKISVLGISTIEGIKHLASSAKADGPRIGVLNFASAKNPGGGFLGGAQAQEESLARSSTLYSSLQTPTAETYYRNHKRDPKAGYYSHAMIYSPRVAFFRNDKGEMHSPIEVDVVTSPAVNAGVVRRELRKINSDDESGIEVAMRERMGRILFLFEQQGARDLVLGSFGTGVFRNNVALVARLWKELIVDEGARYKHSFNHVVFAILGAETLDTFQKVFVTT